MTEDGSPGAGRTIALWEPPLLPELTGENGAPVRRAAGAEAARMLADLVLEGARTLAFVRSRRGAELTALGAQRVLAGVDPELVGRVAAYRGGYLPEERRALESALQTGELLGVATTNALELGMDIAGLDAVVVAGFPGTRASFWQQSGRAGRAREEALVVLVARDDPLDTYLVHHPGVAARRAGGGLRAGSAQPLRAGAAAGVRGRRAAADRAGRGRRVRWAAGRRRARRAGRTTVCCAAGPPAGTGPRPGSARPARWTSAGSGLGQVALVEAATGRMLGTVDARRHRPPRTPARCTCIAVRATWWTRWTSTAGSPWCARPTRTGAPMRAAAPTSRWRGCCCTATTARSGSPSAR